MKEASMIKPLWGKKYTLDNSRSISELKLEYIPMKESLIEMANTMIDLGYLPDKRKKSKS